MMILSFFGIFLQSYKKYLTTGLKFVEKVILSTVFTMAMAKVVKRLCKIERNGLIS